MKNILKISPAILFGLTTILMILPSFDDKIERSTVGLGIWATLILSLVLLSWYYSIGVVLQKHYTVRGAQLFKFNVLFLFFFMPILCAGIFEKEMIRDYIKIILCLCLYFFFAFFQILVYCSKLLAMDSPKRSLEFQAYFQYILLLWLFPIGIWIIQPRMNKLLS